MYVGLTSNDRFTFMAVMDKEREGREGDGESPHCRLLAKDCRLTVKGYPTMSEHYLI